MRKDVNKLKLNDLSGMKKKMNLISWLRSFSLTMSAKSKIHKFSDYLLLFGAVKNRFIAHPVSYTIF